MQSYRAVQRRLARGWNTWNTRSLLCWVHLPEAFALNLGIKSYAHRDHLREVLPEREDVRMGGHAHDGSYSDVTICFGKTRVRVETAVEGDDLVILAQPACKAVRPALLVIEAGVLWNRPGHVVREGEGLVGCFGGDRIVVSPAGATVQEPNITAMTPCLVLRLDGPAGVSTGRARSLDEIERIVAARREAYAAQGEAFGDGAELYEVIRSCMAWNTIYDPAHDRVITPVSRNWSAGSGGYVLCCWDTFFAAMMAAVDNRDLAYANAVEMLHEKSPEGFVLQCSMGSGRKTLDRSMVPVGGITVRALYEKFGDRWFLEETFEDLLAWNRWWTRHRFLDGYMCWGSDPFEPAVGDGAEYDQPNTLRGAKYESGLDNSPMYDDMCFDPQRHLMLLADVGLMSLYAADCEAVSAIASALGRTEEARELNTRYGQVVAALQTLWHDETGMFLNKKLDTGEFCTRLSPTHFYPLLAGAATPEQARRMIDEHFFNKDEFWGEWVLPSIARNDPAYGDDYFWRGRVWAPMNWLVYLGLRRYELPEARAALAERCAALLLKEWRENRHVHENYSAETGLGCGGRSYPFYHWGGLLGLIALMENPFPNP